jgi:hypothetical protein
MRDAGTLQEVVAFMELVVDLRRLCGRPLTVVLLHHENKAGAVSGAWEGSGDTLLHVRSGGNGHTVLHVQKARWDAERHGKPLKLAWADGEGFELEGDRDLLAEVEAFLAERPWVTVREICAAKTADPPGIGARETAVRSLLEGDPERFESRTGDDAKALGRSPRAVLWNCARGSGAVGAVPLFGAPVDGGGETTATAPALKGAVVDAPSSSAGAADCAGAGEQSAQSALTNDDREAVREQQ